MSETIFIKSIEDTNIEFNKKCLCYVSEWFNDNITNMDENDLSIIDEKTPHLSEECLKAFKILSEINHYSSPSQRDKIFKLSTIIKLALPAIEKWDCRGLINLWFNDINNSYNSSPYYYSYYTIDDIIKYESLLPHDDEDVEINWSEKTLLFILSECRKLNNEKKLFKLKPHTLSNIIIYMKYKLQFTSNIKNISEYSSGVGEYIKYN
tara:strand:+ start:50 stop:673 length:624 start_codon:yes stop_codon:yes gene_type:complete